MAPVTYREKCPFLVHTPSARQLVARYNQIMVDFLPKPLVAPVAKVREITLLISDIRRAMAASRSVYSHQSTCITG
jgi:hypothetical protein